MSNLEKGLQMAFSLHLDWTLDGSFELLFCHMYLCH